jgi:uncharacterized membrane protein required for colicin V production
MNLLDIAVAILMLIFLLLGWKIRSFRLLALAAAVFFGVWAGNHFQARLLDGFAEHVSPRAAAVLAWITPCLIAGILVLFVGLAASAVFDSVALGWLDRALGALLAATALLVLLAFSFTQWQASPAFLKPALERSWLTKPLLQTVQPLLQASQTWWPALEKTLSH